MDHWTVSRNTWKKHQRMNWLHSLMCFQVIQVFLKTFLNVFYSDQWTLWTQFRSTRESLKTQRLKLVEYPKNNWTSRIFEDIAIHSNIFLGSTSVLARHGSRKIFLLLNNSSHDPQFSTRKNMEPEEFLEKKIKFFSTRVFQIFDSKHGSPENYSDFFCFSSSRSRAMRSPRHNFSKI